MAKFRVNVTLTHVARYSLVLGMQSKLYFSTTESNSFEASHWRCTNHSIVGCQSCLNRVNILQNTYMVFSPYEWLEMSIVVLMKAVWGVFFWIKNNLWLVERERKKTNFVIKLAPKTVVQPREFDQSGCLIESCLRPVALVQPNRKKNHC